MHLLNLHHNQTTAARVDEGVTKEIAITVKIGGKTINNIRCAYDTSILAVYRVGRRLTQILTQSQ